MLYKLSLHVLRETSWSSKLVGKNHLKRFKMAAIYNTKRTIIGLCLKPHIFCENQSHRSKAGKKLQFLYFKFLYTGPRYF